MKNRPEPQARSDKDDRRRVLIKLTGHLALSTPDARGVKGCQSRKLVIRSVDQFVDLAGIDSGCRLNGG